MEELATLLADIGYFIGEITNWKKTKWFIIFFIVFVIVAIVALFTE